MVAQGFSPGVEMYKYWNPDERRGGIMPRLQYVASLFRLRAHALRRDRVPPHHPVGFGLFFRYTHGFRSRCSLHPWLLYTASPYGEAHKFRFARPPNFNLS